MDEPTDYPPIGDHAFLSDCHTGALVAPDGAVSWMCVPRFDSSSLFGRILDRTRGGSWEMGVAGVTSPQYDYVDNSLILEGHWHGPDGAATSWDFFAVDSFGPSDGIISRGLLVRRIRGLRGTVRVWTRLDARPEYGAHTESWVGEDTYTMRGHRSGVLLFADTPLQVTADGALWAEVELTPGETVTFALDYTGRSDRVLEHVEELHERSLRVWQRWSQRSDYQGVGAAQVHRSATVLRGLLYDRSGGLLAAPTASLPEWLGGERNWDYRFVFHRDASLVVLALLRLGHGEEAGRYLRFLVECLQRSPDRFPPVIGVDGHEVQPEQYLHEWEGYAGSRPVRIGNEATHQWQLDSYGHVLDAALAYHQVTGGLSGAEFALLARLATWVCAHWQEPDHGTWEVQDEGRHWTSSKVYAWVCLDRAIRLAEMLDQEQDSVQRWQRERTALREEILRYGCDPGTGAFVQSYGAINTDASLLRVPLVGFLPGDDPRVLATLDRIQQELGVGEALILRYDPGETDDKLQSPEGAFLLCSFDMVSALVMAGRREEALRRFKWLCAQQSSLGLFSEQMDAEGVMLGNHPQAFTHLALIDAAMNLHEPGRHDSLHAWAERRAPDRESPPQ